MTLEMAVKRVEELEKQKAVVMSKVEDKKVEEKKPKVGKVGKMFFPLCPLSKFLPAISNVSIFSRAESAGCGT